MHKPSSRALLLLSLLIGGAACGGSVHRPDPASNDEHDDEDEDIPPLTSTPWLVTANSWIDEPALLHAQRLREGKLERIVLDAKAGKGVTWSPSGRWLAYRAETPRGTMGLWMRSLDGDTWGPAQLLTGAEADGGSSVAWSPKTDQLLFADHRSIRTSRIAVATPRTDGVVVVTDLFRDSREQDGNTRAAWSPSGDHVVLDGYRWEEGRVVSLHRVGTGGADEGPWPSRTLVVPSGYTVDTLEPRPDAASALSHDGRWITLSMRRVEEERVTELHAFPTDGQGPPVVLRDCPIVGPVGSSDSCAAIAWHPARAVLFLQHASGNGRTTLEAWTPATGERVHVADVDYVGRLAPGSGRLIGRPSGQARGLVLLDVQDLSAPVIAAIPSTELSSFAYSTASPDGRSLLLHHYTEAKPWTEIVDLRGNPPWAPRELDRSDSVGLGQLAAWSPSGRIVLVSDDKEHQVAERITWFDLETKTSRTKAISQEPTPAFEQRWARWSWQGRLAPDDRTVLIPRGQELAVWPLGARMSAAVPLEGTPRTATYAWRPRAPADP